MSLKIQAPWVNFYNEINALFAQDPEVRVVFDEENLEVKLFVENSRKADAITYLLPEEKEFGNVKLKITVVPANDGIKSKIDAIQDAFEGNPALSYVWKAQTPLGEWDYVVFQNKVVQYYNDDMRDINGNRSTLYQEIARDVIGEESNLCFCTEAVNKELAKPLGEWP
jgi:hypothetical protein